MMAKVLVSLDDMLLKRIDRAAKANGQSRSAYLAKLAEEDVSRGAGPGKRPEVRAALRELDRLFEGAPVEDVTATIREMRDSR
jgi:metal-responsive CopG/Arc/MetJ family transcriptional regulator